MISASVQNFFPNYPVGRRYSNDKGKLRRIGDLEAGPPEKARRTASVGRTMALLVTASLNFPNR